MDVVHTFPYRAFSDKFNKARVDHLFSLLFEKALVRPPGAAEKDCISKLPDLLPGVQWLNIPLTAEVGALSCIHTCTCTVIFHSECRGLNKCYCSMCYSFC